jgi:hypothetical protein
LELLPHSENRKESRYERTTVVMQVIGETDKTVLNTVKAMKVLHATNFGNISKESRKQSQKAYKNKHLVFKKTRTNFGSISLIKYLKGLPKL